jgi:hypothetical protein
MQQDRSAQKMKKPFSIARTTDVPMHRDKIKIRHRLRSPNK